MRCNDGYFLSERKCHQCPSNCDVCGIEINENDEEKDEYTCHNNKTLKAKSISHSTGKSGYVTETTIYECEDCEGCEGCNKYKH